MLTENQLNALPERIYERFRAANSVYLEKIGKRIAKIGKLSPAQAERILQMHEYGADIADIEQAIQSAANLSTQELQEIFEIVAEDNYKFSERFYKARSLPQIQLKDNAALQTIIRRYAQQTAESIFGYTQTTAFARWDDNVQDFVLSPLSEAYQAAVEQAVIAVNTGMADYQSAMRQTLRVMAEKGIQRVDYATGYSRRLDTSVRQNILWGVKQCNQEAQREIGREFGADGYEVSYHSNPRPTHSAMGGIQFADSPGPVTMEGVIYPSFYQEYGGYGAPVDLLQDYNCLHFTFPILLGVSPPNWDADELAKMKADDQRTFAYEGRNYTGYEATQMQRRIETDIRKLKDTANIAKAAGDDTLRREVQGKINTLRDKYVDFSRIANLPTKMERMRVSGFHSVKPLPKVVKTDNTILQNTFEYVIIDKNNQFYSGIIPAGALLEDVHIIAGYGSSTKIRAANRLSEEFGGEPRKWQKKTGVVKSKYKSYEMHWYEYDGKQYEIKSKKVKEL